MQPGPVAVATLVGVVAGAVLYLVLRRFVRRPEPVFIGLVVLGALLSLGGPLSLLGASPADQPGVTDSAALALPPLHLVPAAALLVGVLTGRRGRARTA
jgi:drug/metabolite transporter (DMT)-like permease